jgi:hypothetical protein
MNYLLPHNTSGQKIINVSILKLVEGLNRFTIMGVLDILLMANSSH